MRTSRGVVVMYRLALLGALSVGCVAPVEQTASERRALLDGCSKDSQCEDGNPCTRNLCAVGVCAAGLPVLGCCYEGDCTKPDADGAIAPLIELPPAGCLQHEDCEDGHPCTQNLCVTGACAALPVLGCCLDGDCSAGAGGSSSAGGTSNEAGTSSGGAGNEAGTSSGGIRNEAGASSGGTSNEGGTPATSGGDGAMAGAAATGATAAGGATTTDAGNGSGGAATAGAVGASAEADYQLQGGGCALIPQPHPAPSATWLAALLSAATWFRIRRRRGSATAS